MGCIYVDIGPMDAGKAPKEHADKAKAAMRKAVEKAVRGDKELTADRKGEGYTVRLKVAELAVDPKGVSCKVTGELLRYPKAEMVSTSLTGSAKASGGKADALVADCIDGVVEDMMKKRVIPAMKAQARP